MLCDNCGKREANVRYTENINGKVRELNLCEECSEKLGIGGMDFNMPIDFSSFLGGFMDDLMTPEIKATPVISTENGTGSLKLVVLKSHSSTPSPQHFNPTRISTFLLLDLTYLQILNNNLYILLFLYLLYLQS